MYESTSVAAYHAVLSILSSQRVGPLGLSKSNITFADNVAVH